MTHKAKEKARKARVRKVLRAIVKELNNSRYSRELWNILTALRGPDSDDEALKAKTTCQIRMAIGMKAGACGTLIVPRQASFTPVSQRIESGHFAQHYQYALEALERLGIKL